MFSAIVSLSCYYYYIIIIITIVIINLVIIIILGIFIQMKTNNPSYMYINMLMFMVAVLSHLQAPAITCHCTAVETMISKVIN